MLPYPTILPKFKVYLVLAKCKSKGILTGCLDLKFKKILRGEMIEFIMFLKFGLFIVSQIFIFSIIFLSELYKYAVQNTQ